MPEKIVDAFYGLPAFNSPSRNGQRIRGWLGSGKTSAEARANCPKFEFDLPRHKFRARV